MAETTTTQSTAATTNNNASRGRDNRRQSGRGGRNERGGDRRGRRGSKRPPREPREFEQKILDLARVTRVTAGGKRMSFRCALVIGDKKGRVGLGVAKGADVQIAVEKAFRQAKRNLLTVPMVYETIPHPVLIKYGSAQVLLKPAPKGTGLKSGGAMRMILEFAGVPNASSKILNSSNKINIARATLKGLKSLRTIQEKKSKKVAAEKKGEAKPKKTSKAAEAKTE